MGYSKSKESLFKTVRFKFTELAKQQLDNYISVKKQRTDHLGSILSLSGILGTVLWQQNFDAWGRNRNPTNWTYTGAPSVPEWLYRGFTGHEHLAQFALINMNGRVYDPTNGRMLSPDNYVQFPFFSQSFNRYSYVANNPLSFTDPTGNFLGTIFTAIWDFASTVFTKGAIDPWNTSENRRAAWRNFDLTAPWSKTNKAWRINKGLFQTNHNRTFFGQLFRWRLVLHGKHYRRYPGTCIHILGT